VNRERLPKLRTFALPVARLLERSLPFMTYRLSTALRIRSKYDPSAISSVMDWWNHVLKIGIVLFAICLMIAAVMGDVIWLLIGLLLVAGYPILSYRQVLDKAQMIRERIAYALPEFVQNVVIYLYEFGIDRIRRDQQHRGPMEESARAAPAPVAGSCRTARLSGAACASSPSTGGEDRHVRYAGDCDDSAHSYDARR